LTWASKGLGEAIAALIDKLAGRRSNLELRFKDLMLEVGQLKARLNGSVVLDVLYMSEGGAPATSEEGS